MGRLRVLVLDHIYKKLSKLQKHVMIEKITLRPSCSTQQSCLP